jgi:ATP-dependent DNA helicase RecQ
MLPVPEAGPEKAEAAAPVQMDTGAEDLFLRLKALRREIADEHGVPPYVIFPDRTLRELAVARPGDMAGFGAVFGVGEFKREKYGPAFLGEILRELAGV